MLADVINFTPQDYQALRRHAVQFCYQQEILQEHALTDDVLDRFIDHFEISQDYQEYFKLFINKIFDRMSESDQLIKKYAKNWKLYRIAKVDLSILRVAIAEIFERSGTSPVIIISDSLSIAEEFSSKDSAKFINGILDAIARARITEI